MSSFKCVCVSFLLILMSVGICEGLKNNSNTSEKHKFANMSQEEKIEYVHSYLLKEYGVETEIEEVYQRQKNVFQSEDMYMTSAMVDNGLRFTVWIDFNGVVYDTEFALEVYDKVNSALSEELSSYFNNFKLFDSFVFQEMYHKKWNISDDVFEMLKTEEVSNAIYLVLDKNDKNADLSILKDVLQGVDSIVYVYYSDDPEKYNTILDIDKGKYDKAVYTK